MNLNLTMSRNSFTFTLFKKRPTFIDGVSALFDFSSHQNRYNLSRSEEDADTKALQSDWSAIGEDMQKAIEEYAKERNSK